MQNTQDVLEKALSFCKKHPELVYKGIPLAVASYYTLPLVYQAWAWSPWIVSSFIVWERIPTVFKNTGYECLRGFVKIYQDFCT